jgi:hypothetical protein
MQGGIPVLAHPFAYGRRSNIVAMPFLVWYMKTRGIKGLETQTARHGRGKARYLSGMAKLLRMQQTGGMDLHGGNWKEALPWALHEKEPAVQKFLKMQKRKK